MFLYTIATRLLLSEVYAGNTHSREKAFSLPTIQRNLNKPNKLVYISNALGLQSEASRFESLPDYWLS
jgi:hypothetical protein